MSRKARFFLALAVLALSAALLVWSYAPPARVTHVRQIDPSAMQLTTP